MSTDKHILIIGAGVVGVSAALNLQRRGFPVTLADRGKSGDGASFGNAGILVPGAIVPVVVPGLMKKVPGMLLRGTGPLFLRWSYLPALAPWLRKYLRNGDERSVRRIAGALAPVIADSVEEHENLARGTPAASRIHRKPYLLAYRDRMAFEAESFGWNIRRDNGISWREYEGVEVEELVPQLGREFRFIASLEDSSGMIDGPGDYVKALAGSFVAAGGAFLESTFVDYMRDGDSVIGARFEEQEIAADTILIAAGAWSARVLKPLGVDIPLESERGYHTEFWEAENGPEAPVMLADSKIVATPMSGRLRFAGLFEFGGLDAGPSKAPQQSIRAATSAFPNLRWKKETEWLGHRPAPADSIPYIGAVPGYTNVYTAFGHHHVGLTGGARAGRLVSELIAGATPNVDMSPYAVDR